MQEQLYSLSTTSIYGISAGKGPPVICLHGITGNAYVFEPIVNRLANRFHVVSIDQRGHGRSGRPGTYRSADFAADIAALVDELDEGPAILLGHSLGCRNALTTADLYPDHVRAVVALDFTPFIEVEVLDQLEERVNGGNRSFSSPEEIRSYLTNRYPLLPADAIERRTLYGYRKSAKGWQPLADGQAMKLTVTGLRENIEGVVSRITQPTIMVRGALSKLVSVAAWHKTQQLRPDIEMVEIAGSDHYIPEVKPIAVADLLTRLD